jgi:hypothetical protein
MERRRLVATLTVRVRGFESRRPLHRNPWLRQGFLAGYQHFRASTAVARSSSPCSSVRRLTLVSPRLCPKLCPNLCPASPVARELRRREGGGDGCVGRWPGRAAATTGDAEAALVGLSRLGQGPADTGSLASTPGIDRRRSRRDAQRRKLTARQPGASAASGNVCPVLQRPTNCWLAIGRGSSTSSSPASTASARTPTRSPATSAPSSTSAPRSSPRTSRPSRASSDGGAAMGPDAELTIEQCLRLNADLIAHHVGDQWRTACAEPMAVTPSDVGAGPVSRTRQRRPRGIELPCRSPRPPGCRQASHGRTRSAAEVSLPGLGGDRGGRLRGAADADVATDGEGGVAVADELGDVGW